MEAKFKKIEKESSFLLSSFGHTEIEYFGDSNDGVRPLLSKEVREFLLKQKGTNPKYLTYTGLFPYLIIWTTGASLLTHYSANTL